MVRHQPYTVKHLMIESADFTKPALHVEISPKMSGVLEPTASRELHLRISATSTVLDEESIEQLISFLGARP